ncbi:MAG: phosphotransferase [Holosporaceae bacterium]|jgi:streptomycin 6-kinase|nr:phosphotransferase [Holosporaceae bacterium]
MITFEENIVSIHGEFGQKWLNNLNKIVLNLAKVWTLTNLKPFDNLTFNYVLSGFQNKTPIVLKVGIRDENLRKEAQALKFFENVGAIELIDSAKDALLLRRAIPGNSLAERFPDNEDKSIQIAADVIKKLRSVGGVYDGFFTIEDLLSDLYKEWGIPSRYIRKARRIANSLQKTTTRRLLVHGDLHHDNIVKDGDGWKIIDPTGVVADPAYEIASFMFNPIDKIWKREDFVAIIQNRIEKFSKLLNIDPNRILQWTYVKSVLCWIWCSETPNNDRSVLAKLFDKIVEYDSL